MTIVPLAAFQDNYIWALINTKTLTMACVDPGDAAPVIAYAIQNNLQLTDILITHHHNDHLAGLPELLQHAPHCHVHGPCDPRINAFCTTIDDQKRFYIEETPFHLLNIPGHTSSHVGFYAPTKGWFFCGDTLFSAGCGRVFDGTIEQLYHSLQLIKHLPNTVKVYCGHEYTRNNLRFARVIEPENAAIHAYASALQTLPACSLPTTVALEKKINPFFRTDSPTLQAFANRHGIHPSDEIAVFKQLRAEKDQFN